MLLTFRYDAHDLPEGHMRNIARAGGNVKKMAAGDFQQR